MDVYLEPFIEKFQKLWKGVPTFGTHQGVTFNLKAMCMWSIHEFMAYGLFVGCVTKGLVGCPPCGPTTKSWSSRKLTKVVYLWEPLLLAKESSLSAGLRCFQWGNMEPSLTHPCDYNKYHQLWKGTKKHGDKVQEIKLVQNKTWYINMVSSNITSCLNSHIGR